MEVYLLYTWFKGRKFSPSIRGGEILLFDNDAKVFFSVEYWRTITTECLIQFLIYGHRELN